MAPERLIKIDEGSRLRNDAAMALGIRGEAQEDLFVTHQC
jgi:hypothetical protein